MADVINVLLIEDDEDDYFLTSDYLTQCDSPSFNLTWVTNSEDAIAKLKKHSFDLSTLHSDSRWKEASEQIKRILNAG